MQVLYAILAIAGWVWLVLLFGYLGYLRWRKEPRGVEVRDSEKKD